MPSATQQVPRPGMFPARCARPSCGRLRGRDPRQAAAELRHHGVDPADLYRAAVRVVMRMVVVLFAESRELLPRYHALYHGANGFQGLREELARQQARGTGRRSRSWSAWPRVLALSRLVHDGSHHPALPVPGYGGKLFEPGDSASIDGIQRAVAVFERTCFDGEAMPDREVHAVLDKITRTEVKIRQGRSSAMVKTAIDGSRKGKGEESATVGVGRGGEDRIEAGEPACTAGTRSGATLASSTSATST